MDNVLRHMYKRMKKGGAMPFVSYNWCLGCKKPIPESRQKQHSTYCSNTCRKPRKEIVKKTCVFCCRHFLPQLRTAKYCSKKCYKKEYRAKHHKKYRTKYDPLKARERYMKRKHGDRERLLWRLKNEPGLIERRRQVRAKAKKKRLLNPQDRALFMLRRRMNRFFKKRNSKKSAQTMELLGINDKQEVIQHLSSMFTEGMSWDNYGDNGWTIDHILPLNYFNLQDPQEQRKACHYTNLRPIWAKENSAKGDKLISFPFGLDSAKLLTEEEKRVLIGRCTCKVASTSV